MLNIGPAEVLVIALIALIVVGPEQLPGVLRKIGKGAGQLRHMADGLKKDFMAGMDELDPNKWVEEKPRGDGTISDPIISPGAYGADADRESGSSADADPFAGKSTRRLAEEKAARDDAAARAAQPVTKPEETSPEETSKAPAPVVEPEVGEQSDSLELDEGDQPQ